jgi:excinuclease ABC subunit C
MDLGKFKQIQPTIPTNPGIYKYYDKDDKLLYVGKAKNLKKRVSSYFAKKKFEGARLKLLVKRISRIEFTVVNNEQDALLLENSLIKQFQPKYNIQLKDDKTYPFICIKNERFPRVFLTRNPIDDGSEYLGPFTSVNRVKSLLRISQQLFPLRSCKLNLSERNISEGKFKVCLEYHINNCLGPCEGKQSEESYNGDLNQVRNILKGKVQIVHSHLKELLETQVENLEFEDAERTKTKINKLKEYQSKSVIVSATISNLDVYSIYETDEWAFVNFIKVENGTIIQTRNISIKKKLNEEKAEILISAIVEYSLSSPDPPIEIVVPFEIDLDVKDVKLTIPKIGDKKKLLELSNKNVLATYNQHLTKQTALAEKQIPFGIKSLKEELHLKNLPIIIECFDNSNIQGSNPVASMVVFKNGKPLKSEYRKFNIKTVKGPNDFASMKEIVSRRYSRLLKDKKDLPDLIVIDGGKGQLSSAFNALKELGIQKQVPIIGIAKKLEEIFVPGDSLPLYLDKRSESLKVIQRIRDEAHRFAITFHRDKRSQSFISNQLSMIKGIGPKTSKQLLKKYGSIKKLKQVPFEELALEIGKVKAETITRYLNSMG